MTKHTDGAVRAAEKIAYSVWPQEKDYKDKWINHKIEEFAAIIEETTFPLRLSQFFQASIDRLEAEKVGLLEVCEKANTVIGEHCATHYEHSNKEFFDAHKALQSVLAKEPKNKEEKQKVKIFFQ